MFTVPGLSAFWQLLVMCCAYLLMLFLFLFPPTVIDMLYNMLFSAVALEELLDYVFCAGPFDAPAEPTEEQQAADLAAEQAALSALRSGLRLKPPQQQQGLGGGGGQGLWSPGVGGPAAHVGAAAAEGEPAAAAAVEPAAAAATADAEPPAWQRLLPDASLEDTALQLQHWLLQRYSSSSSSTSSSSSLKRLVTCVGNGSDMSLLAPLLPGLKSLGLSVPPCLEGFKSPESSGPVDAKTLPELQLWMGDSGLGFAAKPCSDSSVEADTTTAAEAASSDNEQQQQQQQQQQHKWLHQVAQHPCSFAGSFLTGGPAAEPQNRCFAGLGVLTISNLTRADGPWEPSAVLGDQLLAAVALGCPALKTLEVKACC
jgi:hypothetical protein